MSAKKSPSGLLKNGALGKFLKEAFLYLKDPKRISRLLRTVLTYAKKNKKPVKAFLKEVLLLWEMLNAWFKREYKAIPKKTIILIIAALLYFVSAIDLIPDWLLGGFIDDAALLAWIVQSIAADISKFKAWKARRKK